MHDVPELATDRGPSPRRRLVIAIGGTLVLGMIATTIAREHESREPAPADSAVEASTFDLSSVSSSAIREASPARAEAASERSDAAVDALRDRVDRYLDARAAALGELDTARRQGVDPAVIAAMAAVLGMPAELPATAPRTPTPDDEATPAPGRADEEQEQQARAL